MKVLALETLRTPHERGDNGLHDQRATPCHIDWHMTEKGTWIGLRLYDLSLEVELKQGIPLQLWGLGREICKPYRIPHVTQIYYLWSFQIVPVVSRSPWLGSNMCLKANPASIRWHWPFPSSSVFRKVSLVIANIQRKEIDAHGKGTNLPEERSLMDSGYALQTCPQLSPLSQRPDFSRNVC